VAAARSQGPSRGFFDAWSRVYDFPLLQLATYLPVHRAVLAALRAQPPATVLDVGCGTAQLARRIATAFRHARVIACDFSPGMLARAAAGGHGTRTRRIQLVRADAARLPIGSARIDALVSTEAFHWFPDPAAAIAEFHRVLAPGGRLLLGFVNPPLALIGELAQVATRLAGQPLHWPTPGALRRDLERAGFRVDRQRRIFRVGGFLLPPVLTEAHRPR
jgi:ubiquinone/menaquinone biosynthesis C-methylase UbiE